jgi:hypothetical protein
VKQRKDGKKVQNWHKPPHADALKRRFVRNRHQTLDEIETEPKYDQYWNYRNPGGVVDFGQGFDDPFDAKESRIHLLVRQVCLDLQSSPTPLLPREWIQELPPVEYEGTEECENEPADAVGIETRLKSFVDLLSKPVLEKGELYDLLTSSIGDSENLAAFELLPGYMYEGYLPEGVDDPEGEAYFIEQYSQYETKVALLLFSPFWIRSPKTWDKTNGVFGLIRHLFARYEAPPFLIKGWLTYDFLPRLKWLLWYIQISAGGSLRKLGDVFGWRISNRLQHFLYSVPKNSYTGDACTYAEVMRLGGNLVDFSRLRGSHAFVIDPTEPSAVEGFSSFWESTVCWLISNRDSMDEHGWISGVELHIARILDWGLFQFHESRNGDGVQFSWRGRALSAVAARCQEWEQALYSGRSGAAFKWDKQGWDWEHSVTVSEKWKISELTSTEELAHEGQCMQHCVASYDGNCLNGFASIFSVSRNGHRRLTIEVDPRTKRVVQVRGRKNRNPTHAEADVVLQWLADIVQGK